MKAETTDENLRRAIAIGREVPGLEMTEAQLRLHLAERAVSHGPEAARATAEELLSFVLCQPPTECSGS